MKNKSNQVKILDMAWTSANSGFVEVKSPITSRQLATIDKDKKVGRVQFATKLTQRDHLRLAERLRHFPEIYLRAYELFGSPEPDLDFLQHYKGLKRLSVNLYNLQSVEGIRHIADSLEYFVFGKTKKKIITFPEGEKFDGFLSVSEGISRLISKRDLEFSHDSTPTQPLTLSSGVSAVPQTHRNPGKYA